MIWNDQLSSTRYKAKDLSLNITLLPLRYVVLAPEAERNIQ
jgi:hypothetical protein